MGLFIKSKKEKQQDEELKEYFEQLDKIEEEAEKEAFAQFKEEEGVDNKRGIVQWINLLSKDPNEEEFRSYMTEEEKKQEKFETIEGKAFTITSVLILAGTIITCIVLLNIFVYVVQDDLYKVEQPKIEEYYKSKYGATPKIDDIKYICYSIVNEEQKKEEICTDIIYTKTDKEEIILSKEGLIGDNISTGSKYEAYKTYLKNLNPNMELIWNNPLLTYKDYYYEFNQYYDYINVLPESYNYNKLMENNKLNIIDVIMYQGDIDVNAMKNAINSLDDYSKFIFIKSNVGQPVQMTIIDKQNTYVFNITGSVVVYDNVTNYQIDMTNNNVNDVTVTHLTENSIEPLEPDKYEFRNTYNIDFTKKTYDRNTDRKSFPNYYLLMFNGNINGEKIYEIRGANELKPSQYKDFYTLSFGGKTYIISDQKIAIGNKVKINKKSGIFG